MYFFNAREYKYICIVDQIRQNKVAKVIKMEISSLLTTKFKHLQGTTLVTVTDCSVTPDLSLARVFLSILDSGKRKYVMGLFENETKLIRLELGKKVRNQLRVVPDLRFYLDDSQDRASRIDELLKK